MKKIVALTLALVLVLALAGCGGSEETTAPETTTPEVTAPETTTPEPAAPETTTTPEPAAPEASDAMSHAEYLLADLDSPVVVETYVQAHQSWWDGKVTVYAQSPDGAYFIYNMAATEEEAAALQPGTPIRVTGYKAEWAGEIEITDATFEVLDRESWLAEPTDVTGLLDELELIAHQNELVTFKGMTVEPVGDGAAFLYGWDGSGEEGSDLYFDVSVGGKTYTFTVESYLTGPGTEVYETVKNFQVGDVVDLTGYLYWYEGVNPHITSASVSAMSHAAYVAAELDTPVTVYTYVQAHQSWWDGKVTVYAQSPDGAYFIYNMAATEEEAAALEPGTRILVKGYKSAWSGEVEIVDATFELQSGTWSPYPEDVTALLGTEELIAHQNELVTFTGMTVEPIGDGAAFLYGWDGSGEEGSDLYFNVSVGGATYNFTVESYLTGPGTEVYEAVKALEVGQTVDLAGYLYWYEGANPHIVSVTVK